MSSVGEAVSSKGSKIGAEITNFFDKVTWKYHRIYNSFVANIYDPSKFWLRFAEVEKLQKSLWEFYNEEKGNLKLSYSQISVGLNCVVFIENQYYRARIIKTDIQHPKYFIVFSHDHAKVHRVNINDMFKLDKKFVSYPAFAVRCILCNISPIDNETWKPEAVKRFREYTQDKKLAIKIDYVNPSRKLLEVHLVDPATEYRGKIPTINNLLTQEGLAKEFWKKPVKSEKTGEYQLLRKFMYLYPTHEMIEDGSAPSHPDLMEKLKKCVFWDVLFPEFYKFLCIHSGFPMKTNHS